MAAEPRTCDVAVIGAGINGAGIARDAALRGLSVVLFDKGDVCNGTSWASSRLIHGGLRYLEYGEIPLVYESLHERRHLRRIASASRQAVAYLHSDLSWCKARAVTDKARPAGL